jgi:chromosome segregation ATPase
MLDTPRQPRNLTALMRSRSNFGGDADESILKAERDGLKRSLQDSVFTASTIELRISTANDLRLLLIKMMQDLQSSQNITFLEADAVWERSCRTPSHVITVLRNGIDAFIRRHVKLANRYEMEFSKNLSVLQRELSARKEELQEEENRLGDARSRSRQLGRLIQLMDGEKWALENTIRIRRDNLAHQIEQRGRLQRRMTQSVEQAKASLGSVVDQHRALENEEADLLKQRQEKARTEERLEVAHTQLLGKVENMRAEVARESYLYNETGAALTQAKEELFGLVRSIESYRENLKTRELVDEENENKRLRSVLNIEKSAFDDRLAKQVRKGEELQLTIGKLQERVTLLNQEIADVEDKWRAQMTRIPDFAQLHAALDRERAAGQKQKRYIRQRQEVFDDFVHNTERGKEESDRDTAQRLVVLSRVMPTYAEEKARERERYFGEMQDKLAYRTNFFDELLSTFHV